MSLLLGLTAGLGRVNTGLLAVCRVIAVIALGLMVAFILGQVFFRYVLDDAPSWTEEAARFAMLWMTGLMAPLAYRQGGFVAIDMLERALPRRLAALLALALLLVALAVLAYALDRGLNNHVLSLSGRGDSPSLRLPLDWLGGERVRFRNSWAYASLALCFGLMILVNLELVLRQVVRVLGGGDRLRPLPDASLARAD